MGLLKNMGWGLRWGSRVALVFSAWILVLMTVEGSITLHLSQGHAVSGLAVIAVYVLGGACAGAIVGLMRPLLRWKAGAVVAGALAAAPIFLGVRVAINGFAPWGGGDTFMVVIGSLIAGPLTALLVGDLEQAKQKTYHPRKPGRK